MEFINSKHFTFMVKLRIVTITSTITIIIVTFIIRAIIIATIIIKTKLNLN